jgi:hypothetical protein
MLRTRAAWKLSSSPVRCTGADVLNGKNYVTLPIQHRLEQSESNVLGPRRLPFRIESPNEFSIDD